MSLLFCLVFARSPGSIFGEELLTPVVDAMKLEGGSHVHETTVEVGGAYGSTPAGDDSRRGRRRAAVVGAVLGAGLLFCAAAAAGDAAWRRGAWGELGESRTAGAMPSRAEMSSVAWKTLHAQFRREDAELQTQLGLGQLPALSDVGSGVSATLSNVPGDAQDADGGVTGLTATSRKGAAKRRIFQKYGEQGQSLDDDMGFAGDTGPYSALLQTSAVAEDPERAANTAQGTDLSMLLQTNDGVDHADSMSANGLASNDPRWPAAAARKTEASFTQQAAAAASRLLSADRKASALVRTRQKAARESFLRGMERKQQEELAAAAARKLQRQSATMQLEQEQEDAADDAGFSGGGAHYPSLLATDSGEMVDGEWTGHATRAAWQSPSTPGEDYMVQHSRLGFNDAIQHWAAMQNQNGLSPNQPRSSSTPPGTATLRLAPLQAALDERERDALSRSRREAEREQLAAVGPPAQTGSGTDGGGAPEGDYEGILPGRGWEMDSQDGWEAAMHTDVHCASTVQAMEAGSIGALLGAPKDCIPMSKKPQGYWAYGPPGGGAWKEPTPEENMARYKQWRKDHPKPDNSWAQRDVHRQEELAEGRSRGAAAEKSSGDRGAARRRAGVDREARARVMALEAEVKEATASEKRALRQEEELQAQNMGFVRANGAAKQTQAALRAQVGAHCTHACLLQCALRFHVFSLE